jgi:hypothetical protein
LESFGDEVVSGHQPNALRQVGRRRGSLHECGHDFEIERAGVDLAHRAEHASETEVLCDRVFDVVEFELVVVQQVELILLRADGALQSAQRVVVEQVLDALVGHQQFFTGVREAFAERRHLRGHVVRAPGDRHRLVFGRARGQPGEGRNDAIAYQPEG